MPPGGLVGVCVCVPSLLGEPRSSVEEEAAPGRSSSRSSYPPPVTLQRSFTAVTTQQTPVSNGGDSDTHEGTARNEGANANLSRGL